MDELVEKVLKTISALVGIAFMIFYLGLFSEHYENVTNKIANRQVATYASHNKSGTSPASTPNDRSNSEVKTQAEESGAADRSRAQTQSNAQNPGTKLPAIYPVRGNFRISSPFGYRRDPRINRVVFHNGIDIPLRQGTEIIATGSGTVVRAGYNRALGNYVRIKHNQDYESLYAHLSRTSVRRNQSVTAGQVIGYSGNTGRSTGPHLHYQVNYKGKPVDPVKLVRSLNRTAQK